MRQEVECSRCGFIIELRQEEYEIIDEIEKKNARVMEVYGREGKHSYSQDCPMCGVSICIAGACKVK